MSNDSNPRQEGEMNSGGAPSTSTSRPTDTAPDLDAEKTKILTDTINDILKGIPFIGPYIVIVKVKWGWTGILLLIGGFLIASGFVYTGLFPESVVSARYKSADTPPPAESRDYELRLQQDVSWDAAINNARNRILASGVALMKLNPQLLTQKAKERVNVQVIYVNPCGETVTQRQNDENNQNAAANIKGKLQSFANYVKNLSQTERDSLKVKVTDVYPTMVVIIIDDDLYAYFCPYGAVCSDSPVLVFKGYRYKQPQSAATFFEAHFNAISDSYKTKLVTNYGDPCSSPAT